MIDSHPDEPGVRFLRWRICLHCKHLFQTAETATGQIRPLYEKGPPTTLSRDLDRPGTSPVRPRSEPSGESHGRPTHDGSRRGASVYELPPLTPRAKDFAVVSSEESAS